MYSLYVQVVFINVLFHFYYFIFHKSIKTLNSIKWRLYFIGYQFAWCNREVQNNGDIDKIEVDFSLIQKEDKWSKAGMGLDNHQGSRLLTSSCSDILVTHRPPHVEDDCSVYHRCTRIPASTKGKRERWCRIFLLKEMNQIQHITVPFSLCCLEVGHIATLSCCC